MAEMLPSDTGQGRKPQLDLNSGKFFQYTKMFQIGYGIGMVCEYRFDAILVCFWLLVLWYMKCNLSTGRCSVQMGVSLFEKWCLERSWRFTCIDHSGG